MATPSPSPSKDQDIFGKELGITSAERGVLQGSGEIFLRKVLQVDTHTKKGDPTEPKTLVITNSRCYILSQRPSVKLEVSFNFLKIQLLECTENKLVFQLPGEKPREFHSTRRDSVEIIGLITAQIKNVFPITPLEMVLKLTFDPDSLRSEVTSLRDSLLSSMDRSDASSLQGFINSYAFLCDFFGVKFNSEVVWYLKNVYLAHGFRDLNLSDFNHLSTRDLLPVLSTLRHNQFFEGLVVKNDKLANELTEELCYVVNVTRAIKKLVLHNAGIKPEHLMRLSVALKNNPRSSLVHLDLSDNALDDKSIEALGSSLEALPHGLQHLVLANCKITNKGGSLLAQSMKQNKHMALSLVHFDLSGNSLGPDPQGALTFIQEPQTISYLDLSNCSLTLDTVLQVLIRGCQQHLTSLNLSHNAGKGKKGILSSNVPAKLQQFFSSCIAIQSINLSDCRLTNEIVSAILEGLSVNPNVTSIELDASSNDLGCGTDPGNMAKVISRTSCLHKLNISDCSLDNCMPVIVEAIAANNKLRHVSIGRNFAGKQPVRAAAMEKLCTTLKREDCHILSLSLQDSKLKDLTFVLLAAIADNNSLLKLNISGNQMGTHGARYLAKVLLTNCHLREVDWDHNDTTLCGLQDVVYGLKHNYTLRVMPLPLADIGKAGKEAEAVVQEIQKLLCRNHSDERLKVELAARHRGRLLTTTQQSSVVSRELVQLEDLLKWAESVHGTDHDDVKQAMHVINEANRVLKLTDGLYSPHVESEQFQAISTQVKSLLESFMDQVYKEHIKATSDRMVEQTLRACPSLLTEEVEAAVRGMVLSSSVSSDFTYAKKAVSKKAAPEVVSHVSAINIDVAAGISELIVEQTLLKLDKANLKLMKLHKASKSNSATPDTKVSRNFTFRAEQTEVSKKKKKRTRRPDPEDLEEEEQVDLPSQPLTSDGPALQHLGKTRPKPARMQRGKGRATVKPSILKDDPEPAPAVEEKPPEIEKKEERAPPEPKVAMKPPPSASPRTPSPKTEPKTEPSPKREPSPKTEPPKSSSPENAEPVKPAASPETKPTEDKTSEESPVEQVKKSETPKASPKPSPRRTRQPNSEPPKEDEKPQESAETKPVEPEPTPEPTPEPPTPSPEEPAKQDDDTTEDAVKDAVEDAPSKSPEEDTSEDKKEDLVEESSKDVGDSPSQETAESATSPEPSDEAPSTGDKSTTPPATPTDSKPEPSLSLSGEDEHKQVIQTVPEPKIILPASPVEKSPPQEPTSPREKVAPPKMERASSPPQPAERRGSEGRKPTKERKKTGLSSLFGKKKQEEPKPKPETKPDQLGDWEVLDNKPDKAEVEPPKPSEEPKKITPPKPSSGDPPPVVKERPAPAVREKPSVRLKNRQPPTSVTPEPTPTETTPMKKPLPGGVFLPAVNMAELTSALGKKKPKLPPPTPGKPIGGSPQFERKSASPKPERRATMDPGPPAPKPRPKPRTPKKQDTITEDQSPSEPTSSEPSTDNLDSLV